MYKARGMPSQAPKDVMILRVSAVSFLRQVLLFFVDFWGWQVFAVGERADKMLETSEDAI